MKKTFLSIALISIILLTFSCKNYEKEIIGSWENTQTEITKIDSVVKTLYDANKNYLLKEKEIYTSQMDSIADSLKTSYQKTIDIIDQQLSELNSDTIKARIQKNYKIGIFKFNEDKTMYIKTKRDSVAGSWAISGDTLTITLQKKDIPLYIKSLDSKKLVLVQKTNIQKLNFDIIYTFEKLEKK
jgi:hypothetical protein